jgi:DNA-binding NarL/FixJ family response regulator
MKDVITAVIADDEEYVRIIIKKILTKFNCNILGEASDGASALKLISEKKPDLVILDINMPIMQGDEVLREIKKQLPDTIVLIITQLVDQRTIERFFDLGADNFIRKDYMANQIEEVISESITKIKTSVSFRK